MLTVDQKIAIVTNAKKTLGDKTVDIVNISRIRKADRLAYDQGYAITALLTAIELNTVKDYYSEIEEENVYRALNKLDKGY